MINAFQTFIQQQRLFQSEEKILLAVSGGLDSVVMTDLFQQGGYDFGIAHCNFKLRGADSDGDADFVRTLAGKYQVPFYGMTFETARLARERGQSIQVTARELRYDWLQQVRQESGFDHIATAHHLNDNIETVLFNLTKGCGLQGLQGIPVRNGRIIRPLLFAERGALETYAEDHSLTFREDASNLETKYDRNKIRRQVLPVLQQINPALVATMAANLNRFRETKELYDWTVAYWRERLVKREGNRLKIRFEELRELSFAMTLLHEWLSPLGFHSGQLADLLADEPPQTGALFETQDYLLLVDREWLIIEPRDQVDTQEQFLLREGENRLSLPDGELQMEYFAGRPAEILANSDRAYLDAEKLRFPLRLRHWQPGDQFCPLGMDGRHQKVQDYFSNEKIDRLKKDQIWLVENGDGELVWIVGHRLDHRFRIRKDTQRHVVLHFEKH